MFFYLITLNLARFLNETAPQVKPPKEGSAPELVKKEADTKVTCTVDALKHSETLCAITMRYMLRMERLNLGNSPTANIKGKGDVIHIWKREIGRSSRINDEVVQDQRQRDDNDLQDER
ncbi:hypothetical protein Tco_0298311 [Tanacetum coccineum]